jgi:histone deacetylase 1/2
MCDYDSCLFTRYEGGTKVIICIHVDDLLIVASNQLLLNEFAESMRNRFKAITFHSGNNISFLSMRLSVSEMGISLDMAHYTEKVLSEYEIQGVLQTPADDSLLVDSESEVMLDDDEKMVFHRTVAQLLFLVKRTRLDGLLAVSKLASRVSNPTSGDKKKLERLLKYFNGTKNYGIVLPWGIPMDVAFYIDASFNCDTDGRSRSGAVMTVNNVVLAGWTSKQHLVSRSSTEAEIIGLSDGLLTALWVRNLLNDIGYMNGAIRVYQDNMGSIKIMKDGRKMNHRTKHMSVRYFHAIDCVAKGEIEIGYIPSEDMLADYFTKPLTGKLFYKMRDFIVKPVCDTNDAGEHQS